MIIIQISDFRKEGQRGGGGGRAGVQGKESGRRAIQSNSSHK